MKLFFTLSFLFFAIHIFGQHKTPQDYGFRHLQTLYKGDSIDILIQSRKGEEQKIKPLFLFCQGSLPHPLIIYHSKGIYGVFPFKPDSLLTDYHIAIVSKPYIPLICDVKNLGKGFTYIDTTGVITKKYSDRNLLDYYVSRNIEVIEYIQQQTWISKEELVVGGHSEGSTIAAKLASLYPKITHLIYSGGNPMGRMMSIIAQSRIMESDTDSTRYGEEEFKYWKEVVENQNNMDNTEGDTYKTTFDFSIPPKKYLEVLNIPVLICYGTKDWGTPFNDYLRVEMIQKGKNNFTFKAYVGTEHNYFPVLPNGEINYDIFNWDKVANDWLKWLREN